MAEGFDRIVLDDQPITPLPLGSAWNQIGRYFSPKRGEDVFVGVTSGILDVTGRAAATAEVQNLSSAAIDIRWLTALRKQDCIDTNGNRAANCSLVCKDPALLFGSLDTITNCVTLSAASVLLNQTYATTFTESEANKLVDFGVTNISTFDGPHILRNVAQCALASCQDTGYNRCSLGIQGLAEDTIPMSSPKASLDLFRQEMKSYCNNTLLPFVSITDDIAGPGVLMSHLIQTASVLIFFFLLNLTNLWPRALVVFSKHTEIGNYEKLSRFQSLIYRSTPSSAILSTAVELQEAQAYLTLVIQIATVATLRPLCSPDCTIFDSISSISNAMMSSSLLRSVAVSSILPVVLLQSSLHQSNMRWSYTLLLTIAVCIPAVIVHLRSDLPKLGDMQARLKHTEPVMECGGAPSLVSYCLEAMPYVRIPVIMGVLPLAFVTVALLVADQALHSHRVVAITRKPRARRLRRIGVGIVRALLSAVDAGLLAGIGLHMGNILGLMNNTDVAAGEFTYGQYLASMVWVPVLGKFVYYNIFGIIGGFQGRLSSRFAVVEREREVSNEDFANDSGQSRVECAIKGPG